MVFDHGDADIFTWVGHWLLRMVDDLGEEQLRTVERDDEASQVEGDDV